MNKLIVLIFTAVALTGPVFSSSIKVKSPNGGERWSVGSYHNIKWTARGLRNKINIVLLKDGKPIGLIAKDQDSDAGSFNWRVGHHQGGIAPVGNGYMVRIREKGGKNSSARDKSDASFRIAGKLSFQGGSSALTSNSPGVQNTQSAQNTKTPQHTIKTPDLIIGGIKMKRHKPPNSEGHKSKVYNYLHVKVKNDSEFKAVFPAHSEIVRVSTYGKIFDAYLRENFNRRKLTFYPGDSRDYRFPIIISKPGTVKIPIDVRVDPKNVVREKRENNNSQALSFTHTNKEIDLIVEKIISKGPLTRSGFWITIRIKNIGGKKLDRYDFKIGDKIVDITGTSNRQIVTKEYFSISPGKSKDFKVKIGFGLHVKSRDRIKLIIEVDPDNRIREALEKNNTKTWYTQLK